MHTKLGQLSQLLGRWFGKTAGRFREVRGHSSDPWNDLADALAKFQLSHELLLGTLDWTPFAEFVSSSDFAWAWLLDAPPSLHSCPPPGSEHGIWQIASSLQRFDVPTGETVSVQWQCIDAVFATANVLALGQAENHLPPETSSERAIRLDLQWHQLGVLAIGLQETPRLAGCVSSKHYFGFASGPQVCDRSHHFGCQSPIACRSASLRQTAGDALPCCALAMFCDDGDQAGSWLFLLRSSLDWLTQSSAVSFGLGPCQTG